MKHEQDKPCQSEINLWEVKVSFMYDVTIQLNQQPPKAASLLKIK